MSRAAISFHCRGATAFISLIRHAPLSISQHMIVFPAHTSLSSACYLSYLPVNNVTNVTSPSVTQAKKKAAAEAKQAAKDAKKLAKKGSHASSVGESC